MSFVHLHVHTDFSALDGLGRIPEYVERAVKLGQPALAITDHGSISGAHEHYTTCKKQGIEPVIGEEFYVVESIEEARQEKDSERHHLTVLAKGYAGYRVLCELSTEAHRNFYYKPLIDTAIMEQLGDDARHLVVLSGCAASMISQMVLKEIPGDPLEEARWWKSNFPNFYIELMRHRTAFDDKLNKKLIDLAHKLKLPVVFTNDPHYVNPEDAPYHECLLAIQTNSELANEERFRFDGANYYLRSDKNMRQAFKNYEAGLVEEGLANTAKIAEQCRLDIPEWNTRSWRIPKFPDTEDAFEEMKNLAWKGLSDYGFAGQAKYEKRLKRELKVFKEVGIADFMLITRDIIAWARERMRVGPGRGSTAASLVAYFLDIHRIDPIHHNLLFERFLNPARPKMPDIDTDFPASRREEVFDYTAEKYGAKNVMPIASFGTMKLRASFRKLAKAHGISYAERNRIANLLGTTWDADEDEDEDDDTSVLPEEITSHYPDLADQVKHLVGIKSHLSSHPAGVIIFDEDDPIRELVPQLYLTRSKKMAAQFDYNAIEAMGLLKEDILSLRALDTIEECLRLIGEGGKEVPEPDDWLPDYEDDDDKVYKLIADGFVGGVFQMEGPTMQRAIQDFRPNCFEDIVSITSLWRAGPIIAGAPHRYLKNRSDNKVRVVHPSLKPILSQTWGEMAYQEQMMEIANKIAGFDMAEVDDLKETVRHKDPARMRQMEDKFVSGCQRTVEATKTQAQAIWKMIEAQSLYLFNRAHAVSYSTLSYQTARLKLLYPLEFITALLRTVKTDSPAKKAKRYGYLAEATDLGFKILTPDINISEAKTVCVQPDIIRFGFEDLAGIGPQFASRLVKNRNSSYALSEAVRQITNNIKAFQILCDSGCLVSLGIEGDNRKAQELLDWQFEDRMRSWRKKLRSELTFPNGQNNVECCVAGEIVRIEKRKTRKDTRPFHVWTIRWKPSQDYTITIWDSASSLFELKRGAIVRVDGKYQTSYHNIGVADADQVEVLAQ